MENTMENQNLVRISLADKNLNNLDDIYQDLLKVPNLGEV